jgi:membrane protease YdiL (CAAX protease family)
MSIAARLRAFGWFLIAFLFALLARDVAMRAARGLASSDWFELTFCAAVLFLLLLGFAAMGMVGQGQQHPLAAMGLGRRPGWRGEFGLGAALGWGALIACILPLALFGGMSITYRVRGTHLVFLVVDLVVLALASLAEEVVFRGYPFQRLIEATGPLTATVLMSLVFAAVHGSNPDSSWASLLTTMLAGWLMALAYLRTRALWVAWGFHFAWNASMAVLFGLPVSGITTFSPVVSTYTRGPIWLTGGGYGPEGSAVAIVVLLIMMFVVAAATEDLKHEHAGPVIVPGGIPVDLDAISRRQHEAAMGPAAPPPLVQIAPPAAPPPLPTRLPEE